MSKRRSIALPVAAAALAVAASPASAATVKVAGGSTTLKLNARTAKALDSLGVGVSPLSPAKVRGGGLRFPVSGGAIDPAAGAGVVRHTGGLQLRAGSTRVRLTSPRISVGDRARLSVRVGGKRLQAFTLGLGKAKVSRPGGINTKVTGVRVSLSARGAAALNRAFGVRAFRSGLRIGTATVNARAAEIAFSGGTTSLALDAGAAAALTSLGVSAAPAAPATANADGSLAFPITGGNVAVKTLAGSITHSGGITFSKGATSVTVSDFTIDTASMPPKLTAAVGSSRIDLLSLDLGAAQVGMSGRDVTVGGVVAKLSETAAAALNQAFGTSAFTAGLTIGTATVAGQAA